MKNRFWLLLLIAAAVLPAQAQRFQVGTVTRMQSKDCTIVHSGFVTALGGVPQRTEEICPEYTLVSDKVVYVVVGKRSSQFMPLAELVYFHLVKNELLVRVDDEKKRAAFPSKKCSCARTGNTTRCFATSNWSCTCKPRGVNSAGKS